MGWEKNTFGSTADGRDVFRFTTKNSNGVTARVITLGATITGIELPGKSVQESDVVWGFDTVAEYESNPPYLGSLIGRVGNRIHHGKFTLEGKDYSLAVNNGPNHLHGGLVGFNKKLFSPEVNGEQLKLSYTSPDGEEGYPGELTVHVTYELNNDNELVIEYTATTSATTVVNMTNHAYFNLAGHTTEDVSNHMATVFADQYTVKNEDGVPSGEIANVAGTAVDLRKPVKLGEAIGKVPDGCGFDMNYCLPKGEKKTLAARVEHEASGRSLEVYTDQPGVQFYTSHYLDGIKGKHDLSYKQYSAFCLETQNYPDAINHSNFPSPVLKKGEVYKHMCWYKFGFKG